jgi:DNA (cytosine-5)-methyltransferase 1
MSSGQANAEITQNFSPALNCNRDGAPICFHATQDPVSSNERSFALGANSQQAVAIRTAQTSSNGYGFSDSVAYTLDQTQGQAVAFTQNQVGDVLTGEIMHSLATNQNATGRNAANVMTNMQVRRLTPVECERLQAFPDNYTRIPWRDKPEEQCPDGPRYKALGNSMATNVMRHIGDRIELVTQIMEAM